MRSTRPRGGALTLSLVVALFAPLSGAAAPPQGKGNPHQEHKQQQAYPPAKVQASASNEGPSSGLETKTPRISASIGFDQARRIAVANHYTGYSALPPGIRKNLARGKPLPPGIAKKAVPRPMLAQLPSYPGYEWRIYGSDLVLVAVATAVIADVLFDVLR